jgi:hypothetical protein
LLDDEIIKLYFLKGVINKELLICGKIGLVKDISL